MRLIDADCLIKHKMSGEIGELSGDFVPGFAIAQAPTIEAEPVRHGRWVTKTYYDEDGYKDEYYVCSECGRPEEYKQPYCNCGAKMDAKEH